MHYLDQAGFHMFLLISWEPFFKFIRNENKSQVLIIGFEVKSLATARWILMICQAISKENMRLISSITWSLERNLILQKVKIIRLKHQEKRKRNKFKRIFFYLSDLCWNLFGSQIYFERKQRTDSFLWLLFIRTTFVWPWILYSRNKPKRRMDSWKTEITIDPCSGIRKILLQHIEIDWWKPVATVNEWPEGKSTVVWSLADRILLTTADKSLIKYYRNSSCPGL